MIVIIIIIFFLLMLVLLMSYISAKTCIQEVDNLSVYYFAVSMVQVVVKYANSMANLCYPTLILGHVALLNRHSKHNVILIIQVEQHWFEEQGKFSSLYI